MKSGFPDSQHNVQKCPTLNTGLGCMSSAVLPKYVVSGIKEKLLVTFEYFLTANLSLPYHLTLRCHKHIGKTISTSPR